MCICQLTVYRINSKKRPERFLKFFTFRVRVLIHGSCGRLLEANLNPMAFLRPGIKGPLKSGLLYSAKLFSVKKSKKKRTLL